MPGVWKNKLILLAVCFRVWQEGPLYFLQEACLGDFFRCELWFEFFLIRESWLKIIRSFHVRVKYLFFLFKRDSWMMTELNVIRKPFFILRDEFPAFQLFWKWIVLERLWQDTNFIWINKIHKQTSNDPWTNNVRHSVIICHLRLVKTRKIENLVGKFGLLLWYEISQMREQEISFHEVWKGQIFLCDWGLQRGTGKPLTAQAAQAHVSRKSQRSIHECVTRCVTQC